MTEQIETAALTNFRVVGYNLRKYQSAPGAPIQPGGSCWHCGTGIMHCYIIEDTNTGGHHEIGSTCAERVGLSKAALKAYLADKFAEQRYANSAANRKRQAEEWEARDALETKLHGAHGTESRFKSGCLCNECHRVAPHGTMEQWGQDCRCMMCIDAALGTGDYRIMEKRMVVHLASGEVMEDAKIVDTKFGSSWCIPGSVTTWMSVSPKRRSTQSNKGFVEATIPYLVEPIKCRDGRTWNKPVCAMGSPFVDSYGERISRIPS